MIVYISPAETNGGILQFSTTITRETNMLMSCKLFLPNIVETKFYEDIFESVITYKKVKTLNKKNKDIMKIAKQIIDLSPRMVIFVEDSILMQQLNGILHNHGIKTAMIIHDIEHHPYRNMGLRRWMIDIVRRKMMKRTAKKCSHIILLSDNSENEFKKEYKRDNTMVFRLPAHIPCAIPEMPPELKTFTEKYFLFFGRIDEYKGIEQLCRAYSMQSESFKIKNRLIIAGKGNLSEKERNIINTENYIILINRFIDDGEMLWLFQNASVVVLPYIEASQSGVLPIAYNFGKPVLVSDLPGLTENVLNGKTGYVFKNADELKACISEVDILNFSKQEIEYFYKKNYSWENNLRGLIDILITKER